MRMKRATRTSPSGAAAPTGGSHAKPARPPVCYGGWLQQRDLQTLSRGRDVLSKVGRLMQRLSSQYARRVHRRQGNGGHLFHTYYRALGLDPRRNLYANERPIPMADPQAAPIQEVLA